MVGTGGGFLTIRLGRSSLVNRKSSEGWKRGESTAIRGSCEPDSLLVEMFKYEGRFTYTTAGPNRNWCEARVAIRAATFGPFSPASITDNQSRAPQRLATTRFGLNSRDSSPALISRQTWRSGLFGISRGRPRLAPPKVSGAPDPFRTTVVFSSEPPSARSSFRLEVAAARSPPCVAPGREKYGCDSIIRSQHRPPQSETNPSRLPKIRNQTPLSQSGARCHVVRRIPTRRKMQRQRVPIP